MSGAPRVLVVSRFDPFEPRPQPYQLLSAAHGLAAAGARVTAVLDAHGRAAPSRGAVERHLGFPLGAGLELRHAVGVHPGARGVRRRWLLLRLLREPWDAILSRDPRTTRAVAGLRSLAGSSAPLLHEWHAIPSALGERDDGERAAARAADAHVVVSTGLAGALGERGWLERRRHAVLPNACHLDDARARVAIDALPAARDVLCASLLRGPADRALLGAIGRGLPRGLRLCVAGPLDDSERDAAGVHALGLRSPAEVAARLPGCLAQLALYRDDLNTRRFASPLKVAQAPATGVPLVATDLPTVRALVRDGRDAALVAPGDAGAVIAALRSLRDDRRAAMALAGAAAARAARWSWRTRGAKLIRLIGAL